MAQLYDNIYMTRVYVLRNICVMQLNPVQYASEDVVTQRSQEPGGQASYFVIYQMDKAEVMTIIRAGVLKLR